MVTSVTIDEGVYNYRAELRPGSGLFAVGSVHIKKPGSLGTELNSCPQVIMEGQNISCVCRYPDKSQPVPPASIKWANATAMPSSVLEIRDVSREQNGRVYVCTSQWGPGGEVTDSVKYSFDVVYGPVEAKVNKSENSTNDLQSLTLTCKVQDVFPSANFSWPGVSCIEVTQAGMNSSCTLDRATLPSAGEVVCLAVNSKFPGLNVSAYFALPSPEKVTSDDSRLPIIGGTVAGAVVVAVIITVILIVIIRRRRIKSKSSPKPRTNFPRPADDSNDSREYVNDMYESSDTLPLPNSPVSTMASAQTPSKYDEPPPDTADNVYDNLPRYANVGGASGPSENATVSEPNCLGHSETSANVTGEVYAQVQKKPKQERFKGKKASSTQDTDQDTQDQGNMYAQVDKKRRRKPKAKAKGKTAEDSESSATAEKKDVTEQDQRTVREPDSVVYENYGAEGRDSEEVYMNVG